MNLDHEPLVSAEELAQWLGQPFPPTPQQSAVITAPAEPLLVVAGAGAGKTETMAARVVWLVANKYVSPDAVLGLTFTRKAAQELGQRIRQRLKALAACPQLVTIDEDGQLAKALATANPTTLTYDAYAGRLIREYGLLLPVEPTSRLISGTEQYLIARDVVEGLQGDLHLDDAYGRNSIVDQVLLLKKELDDHLISLDDVREETEALIALVESLPPSKRAKDPEGLTTLTRQVLDAQARRLSLLPAVAALQQQLRERNVMTFAEQMSVAARLARGRSQVRTSQRQRFRAVMLDEYQDTSAAQRILLSHLFGDPNPQQSDDISGVARGIAVTAVGDPMQAIYSWRGATASNLVEFVTDFPVLRPASQPEGLEEPVGEQPVRWVKKPAETRELTTSWRNPPEVLALANQATVGQLGALDSAHRIVSPLVSRQGAAPGRVLLGRYATAEEENAAVAEALAEDFWAAQEAGQTFTGAVLVRQHKQTPAIAAALRERDVPVEIVGLAGLLQVPEVVDVLAVIRMLVRPQDDVAALRILLGPHINLGLDDLRKLAARARNLAGRATKLSEKTSGVGAGEVVEVAEVVAEDDKLVLDRDAADLQGHVLALLRAQQERLGVDADVVSQGALEKCAAEVARLLSATEETRVGLADAIADLDAPEKYSVEGYRRLAMLSSELRELRRNSLGSSLTDLVSDVEQVMGLRAEVLTRESTGGRAHVGAAHLDRFAEEVAAYGRIPGASVVGMLDYFELAVQHDQGLTRGEVAVSGDRVQILTVHKAKGLEWQSVAVVGVTDRIYGERGVSTWATSPGALPTALRADADAGHRFGAPVLDTSEVEDQTQLKGAVDAFKKELRAGNLGEVERLFYVALTRAERHLIVTSAADNGGARPDAPFGVLERLCAVFPEFVVDAASEVEAATGAEAEAVAGVGEAPVVEQAPVPRDFLEHRAVGVLRAADWVRAEYERLVADADAGAGGEGDRAVPVVGLWDREVRALVEEARRADAPTVTVNVGSEVTASDLVSCARDPEEFARRRRRPQPFRPNVFAKRGTALHQWIEDHYGRGSLLDAPLMDDSVGFDEEGEVSSAELAVLQEKFLASRWADMDPVFVEYPFTVSLGSRLVSGRIDAIFHEGDDPASGWLVVDWKSSRPPVGAEADSAAIQLAVYRYALGQLLESMTGSAVAPEGISAGFFYIGFEQFFQPGKLPGAKELELLFSSDDGA
ncbi:UvrD-helicase domain-containing protein [Corynebacterium aquilae]|uniref:UvrD-helicase domain-containing protein n=1 Tax=Corynebacterium aquilae TaxID=203263 RepID=UPI000950C519|nr:UvrD-helicase domain-containing protein [Corynebacterium aquilae]